MSYEEKISDYIAFREWGTPETTFTFPSHEYLMKCMLYVIEHKLPKKQKDYLILYLEGLGVKEIADYYMVDKSTVSRQLKRAVSNIMDYASVLVQSERKRGDIRVDGLLKAYIGKKNIYI